VLYYWLKQVHVYSVLISFALFAGRGAWVLGGRNLPRHRLLRSVPHLVDTVLLASAVWLTMILHQYPLQNSWLTAKVGLLVAYILLGSLALRYAPGRPAKAVAFAAAVLTFVLLVSVARYRHPLGVFAPAVS
jgi:uncharacterized membrane protein SirB2